MIPTEILKVVKYLKKNPISLPKGSGDARRDSATAENTIISYLQNQSFGFNIVSPNIGTGHNRSWYDIQINNYHCDIKISELKTTDNTNAKKAIFYLLTGLDPNKISNTEKVFFKEMKKKESVDEHRDYFYIVINKIDIQDVFALSLKGLKEVQIAPNNLPFQCNWNKNRDIQTRNWQNAKDFLLSKWAKSIQQKIENTKKGMPEYYSEYFDSENKGTDLKK